MSSQIVPQRLDDQLAESGPVATAVTAEMFAQRRLDTARLEAAAEAARS
ncbi:hypothetical protein GCM10009592_19520 [Brachybacterium rhamnosum]|uniref:Uncharacterized protein n=1 Tax=Brachybacterium rhamnosum TaxID=173361 RepID=A0ABW4Q1D1_9MICO|nr:hypothetical protein [Brachybacterium sp. SGAir0954]